MKKLVFTALLCGGLAQLGTGCIFVTDDDDDTIAPPPPPTLLEASVDLEWDLRAGPNNDAVNCPPNVVTTRAVIISTTTDETLEAVFNCEDLAGNTGFLDIDTYDISIELLDEADTLIAASPSVIVELLDSDDGLAVPLADPIVFSVDHGSFFLRWLLVNNADNAAITCGDVPGGAVEVGTLTTDEAQNPFNQEFRCDAGEAQTEAMAVGSYLMEVDVLDGDKLSLQGLMMPLETSLDFGSHLQDLGEVVFGFDLI